MSKEDLIPTDLDLDLNLRKTIKVQGYKSKTGGNVSNLQEPVTSPPGSSQPGQGSGQGSQNGQACDLDKINRGNVTPYVSPTGAPPLPPGAVPPLPPGVVPEEHELLAEHLAEMNRVLSRNNDLLELIKDYLGRLSSQSPSGTYFEIETQTRVATTTEPTQDTITNGITPGYDFVDVNNRLQGRNAQQLWVVNDGPPAPGAGDNLFIRTSADGSAFSPEFSMIVGEVRKIYDVYEVRFRSPKAANVLRMSEREIIPPYVTSVTNTSISSATANRPNFTAQNIPVGVVDITLPDISIPDGYFLAIRANVNNPAGTQIFISRTNATVAANRITLNVGDTASLGITNANLIHVAGSAGALSIDLLVEQD